MVFSGKTDSSRPDDPSRVQSIAELVRLLCTALVTAEMFPSDHPQTRAAVSRAYAHLAGIFARQQAPVVISAAGTQIVFDGLPLQDRNPLVSKLAAKLEEIHVKNMFFTPALTEPEFQDFYRLLGKGARYINEHGGMNTLMAEAQIQNVQIRDVSYVLVTEDQKVVSRDAKVVDDDTLSRLEADAEVARYIAGAVLKRAEEQKWLLTEMKNEPQKMAALITEGINLATSRAGTGAQNEPTIEALVENIKLLGRSLIDDTTDQVRDGQEDLERAVLRLENELRMRSKQLTSSKVAAGFINEILALVSSYSDRVRAKRLSTEFVKDEKALRQTEKLIKELAPQEEPVSVLTRIRELILRGGVSEDAVNQMVTQLQDKKKRVRPPRLRPKPALQTAAEIERRLAGLNLAPDKLQEAVASLSRFVDEQARKKSSSDMRELGAGLARRERALNAISLGVILWDPEGRVEFANALAKDILKGQELPALRPPLADIMRKNALPLTDRELASPDMALSPAETKFLATVSAVLADGDCICGAILTPRRP